jgi:hypothetical protein
LLNTQNVILGLFCLFIVGFIVYNQWDRQNLYSLLPEKVEFSNKEDAVLEAKLSGKNWSFIYGTGSMYPYIRKDEENPYNLVAISIYSKKAYHEIKRGDLIVYFAEWDKSKRVLHQAVQKDSGGWIASGFNNERSESEYRITEESFIAIIEKIYYW